MNRTYTIVAVSFKTRSFKTIGGWVRVLIPDLDLITLRVGKSYGFEVSQTVDGEWVATEFKGERM